MWFVLINHLRIEWTLNPQYAYGWAVPFLCLYLLYEKLKTEKLKAEIPKHGNKPNNHSPLTDNQSPLNNNLLPLSAFAILAFLWFPTRLIEEANPEWRLVSWALALITVGLTILAVRAWLEGARQRYSVSVNSDGLGPQSPSGSDNHSPITNNWLPISAFSFPLFFFLVSVPWPTVIEGPLIQGLMRANVAVTIELLNLFGVPALQHGNVIEVATGVVGIDEACSGIRSFQATLMISLFFGELYRLKVWSRMFLVLAGFAMSFGFNIIRTSLLTWVAARDGVDAIDKWHDPAGVTILVACFVCLWLLSLGVRGNLSYPVSVNGNQPESTAEAPDNSSPITDNNSPTIRNHSPITNNRFRVSAFALLVWLLASEVAVEAWYRVHERNLGDPATWTVNWPEDNPTFQDLPLTETTEQYLRFDEGRNASWTDADRIHWQGIFLRWDPGRTAVHLAKNHTPEACLAAVGLNPKPDKELDFIVVNGLALPFRHYTIDRPGNPTHVYYCLWEDRGVDREFDSMSLTYANRLEPVLAGRRLTGQRSLEVIISGISDPVDARTHLADQLQHLIHIE